MTTVIDLAGNRFGKLVVISKSDIRKNRCRIWECQCDCGNVVHVDTASLNNGNTRSCGCLQRETARLTLTNTATKHGSASRNGKTPEYIIWLRMRNRCNNPHDKSYSRYGGRGIVVCDEWNRDFLAFFRDMGTRPSNTHSIERLDNDGPYSPSNCVWATVDRQANNKRNNVTVTFNGKTQTLAQWSAELGINYFTLYRRIVTSGWDVEAALTKPLCIR